MGHVPLVLPEHSSCSFWVCQAGEMRDGQEGGRREKCFCSMG